ncbi:hypothetical protein JR782_002742 [Salmonella enterica subsp. enterica serovar Eastbourne]|nr:hypothetical protein [Salmonella enterica subsp. enterica serovar Eastbourne]EHC5907845.1 hypothetical protein [Salmonella enterica subsp. enterica serovar Eastbourne]
MTTITNSKLTDETLKAWKTEAMISLGETPKDCRDYSHHEAILALVTELQERRKVQAGWVMVPREPTKSMRMAIHPLTEATCMNCGCKVVAECEDNIFMSWDDMLSAAPQPEGTNGK